MARGRHQRHGQRRTDDADGRRAVLMHADAALDALAATDPVPDRRAATASCTRDDFHPCCAPSLVEDLRCLEPLDPIHMPASVALISAMEQRLPGIRQVACFDTAFHRTMPAVATTYPVSRWARDAGVRRYGFHGLSCESVLSSLADQGAAGGADPDCTSRKRGQRHRGARSRRASTTRWGSRRSAG